MEQGLKLSDSYIDYFSTRNKKQKYQSFLSEPKVVSKIASPFNT